MLRFKPKKEVSPLRALRQIFYSVIALIGLVTIGMFILIYGLDKSIDNQNQMSCESARVSGNWKYEEVCAEYYKTGNIRYMRNYK